MTSNEKVELLVDRVESWIEDQLGIVIQDEGMGTRDSLKNTLDDAFIEIGIK